MSMTVDLSAFTRAMQKMTELPNKLGPEILNANVLKVAIGAKGASGLVQITQKATEARIRSDMSQIVPTQWDSKSGRARRTYGSAPRIIAMAAKWLSKRGIRPRNGSWAEMEAYRQEVSRACAQILAARIQSRAYIAAGWLWAARALAPHVKGARLTRLSERNMPTRADGSASESYAKIASAGNLLAGLFNTSRGAGSVCPDSVVQIAVNNATEDMLVYLREKFGEGIDAAIKGA